MTRILTHGHGPKAIAQYSAGVWGAGPNPIVGSIDSILWMLENPQPSLDSLLEGPHSTQVFDDLFVGKDQAFCARVKEAFKEDMSFISGQGTKRPFQVFVWMGTFACYEGPFADFASDSFVLCLS